MALTSEGGECGGGEREGRTYNNPFARRGNGRLERAPIEEYIKAWIEDIFYNNKKIDIQAKASIYRKLISDKFYELSSCSIVYSIIREKIKEICLRLRSFINLSYHALHAQQCLLSHLGQGGSGGGECLSVAVARGYVISYRYMCEVAKETFNFWKILYECTQVKDLRFNSLQNSLNEFILDTFVAPSGALDPRSLLPNIAFPLKCKFIYAEPDGIKKREELTRFYDDDTVRRLLRREDSRTAEEELERARARLEVGRAQEGWSVARKYEIFHRPRMDLKDLEHLRRCYLDPEAEANEEALFASLFPPAPRDAAFSQEKLDLIRSLEQNHEQLFEIEDASSQDDSPDPLFYDDAHPDREELLDQQDNIEIELSMNPEKHLDAPPSDGSTKSEPTDDPPEHPDLPMRNYESEPPPPEFIMPEQPQEGRDRERAEVRRAIELLSQYSHERHESSSSSEGQEEKMAKLKVNIAKSKEMRGREKKVEFLDKRQLEEEKEKLEKYRRELEKEKEELLREVEKFMKEKKKESNLLALIKDKARYKFTRNYKCNTNNHKIIHKLEKHQQKIESMTLEYGLNACDDELLYRTPLYPRPQPLLSHPHPSSPPQPHTDPRPPHSDPLAHIIDDKAKMREIQQAVAKDLIAGDAKLTKKQQKLKKKLEHEATQVDDSPVKLESKKSERAVLTEQEAALTNFLERLRIDEDARTPCNVEEQQIQQWRARALDFRKGHSAPLPPPCEQKEAVGEGSARKEGRKRKKNRR